MPADRHIDDEQAATVDQHFDKLIKNNSYIDPTLQDLTIKELPPWYNEKLFKVGQIHYQRNLLAMTGVSLLGLLSVMIIPTIIEILVWTKQSGTPCTAFKRYLETILHIHTLYTADIKDPNSRWWKSLNTIRRKHATSSRKSGESGAGEISQRDMALTQFGFLGYALLVPGKFGLTSKTEDRQGLNHFWRVVGNVLGISDELNICRRNEAETTALCKRLRDEIYAKHMNDQPEKFELMASALLDGLWFIDMTIDTQSILYFWYNISGLKYKKPLGLYSRLNYKYRQTVIYLLGVPVVGYLIRIFFNYYLLLCYWIAENYPIPAWIRFGRSHVKINLYPYSK